jgi:hypothetical protein
MDLSGAQGAGPTLTTRSEAKAGRNHLNEYNIPLFPTGIGERYRQTISNLCQGALLRRCELPLLYSTNAELTQRSLYLIITLTSEAILLLLPPSSSFRL